MSIPELAANVRDGHARGWSFTPLDGKKPTLKGWTERPREPLAQALKWAAAGNVGLRTGRISGVVVVDADPGADIDALKLPPTVCVKTGRGVHFYFAHGEPLGNSAGKLAPHVDVKADGGQVVFPGSVHPDTEEPYLYAEGCAPWEIELAPLPQHVIDALSTPAPRPVVPRPPAARTASNPGKYAAAALAGELAKLRAAPQGERNSTLNAAAFALGQLVADGRLVEADVRWELAEAAAAIGLPSGEAAATIESGLAGGNTKRRADSGPATPPAKAADVQAEAQALFSGEPEAEPSPEPGAQADTPEPWQPFPVELLPPTLRDFVTATADALDCEPAFVALPTLPVVAAAVGTTRAIELKASWREPCIVWSAVVARSGTLKSPAFDAAVKPLRRLQTQALRRYAEDCELHAAQGKATGEKPPKPPPRYFTIDATLEVLAPLLERNPRGLLVARDELSGWVRGFDAYKAKGRGGDAAGWLEVWRAGTLCVDRKTSTSHYVHRAAVGVCGTIQPGVLSSILAQGHFENGLAARLLLAHPPERLKVWTMREPPRRTLDAYAQLVGELLTLEHKIGDYGPEPVALPLSIEARPRWEAWYNQHARRQHDAPSEKLAASFAKVEAYAARFALLFTLCNEPHATSIPADALDAGCKVADWFAQEQERVYGTLGDAEEQADAQRLLALVASNGGRITARELQRCCRAYPTASAAEAALEELVKSGRGKWERPAPGPGGGRPVKVFVAGRVR